MKKKIVTFILIAALAVMTACGGADSAAESTVSKVESATEETEETAKEASSGEAADLGNGVYVQYKNASGETVNLPVPAGYDYDEEGTEVEVHTTLEEGNSLIYVANTEDMVFDNMEGGNERNVRYSIMERTVEDEIDRMLNRYPRIREGKSDGQPYTDYRVIEEKNLGTFTTADGEVYQYMYLEIFSRHSLRGDSKDYDLYIFLPMEGENCLEVNMSARDEMTIQFYRELIFGKILTQDDYSKVKMEIIEQEVANPEVLLANMGVGEYPEDNPEDIEETISGQVIGAFEVPENTTGEPRYFVRFEEGTDKEVLMCLPAEHGYPSDDAHVSTTENGDYIYDLTMGESVWALRAKSHRSLTDIYCGTYDGTKAVAIGELIEDFPTTTSSGMVHELKEYETGIIVAGNGEEIEYICMTIDMTSPGSSTPITRYDIYYHYAMNDSEGVQIAISSQTDPISASDFEDWFDVEVFFTL